MGELSTDRGINADAGAVLDEGSDAEVSKGDALADEESVLSKVSIKSFESTELFLEEVGVGRFGVAGNFAVADMVGENGVNVDFALSKVNPLVNLSSFFWSRAEQVRVGSF